MADHQAANGRDNFHIYGSSSKYVEKMVTES
jgi:hypothetical protein